MENVIDIQVYTLGRESARTIIEEDLSNGVKKSKKSYRDISRTYKSESFIEGFNDSVDEYF